MIDIKQMHQAWKQSDYDPVQGRPSFVELVMDEFKITREEALRLLEDLQQYPK